MSSNLISYVQLITGLTFMAAIPAAAWWLVFYKKQREDRLHSLLTFGLGGLAVFPILYYKYLWQFFPSIDIHNYLSKVSHITVSVGDIIAIPLSVILFFAFVGVLEEIMKLSVVHAVDDHRLRHIDDAIMFSIIAALGFSFVENISYFYDAYTKGGVDTLFVNFIFRSLFSTFAHVLFSAICGYYYGIGHFAKPLLQKELTVNRHRFWSWFHRIFKFKTENFFHEEKILQGLFISVILHGVFDIFLQMRWDYVMVPYLVVGYLYVRHLFNQKENHRRLDLLMEEERNNVSLTPNSTRRWDRLLKWAGRQES